MFDDQTIHNQLAHGLMFDVDTNSSKAVEDSSSTSTPTVHVTSTGTKDITITSSTTAVTSFSISDYIALVTPGFSSQISCGPCLSEKERRNC